ncbi:MAG: hypothetical protein WAP74_03040 [Patescibacteria group bacterium]
MASRGKWVLVGLAVIALVGIMLFVFASRHKFSNNSRINNSNAPRDMQLSADPVKAGRDLARGKCSGTGVPYKLSVSPMKPEDFSVIIPYGLVVGDHVTPIDHQYFAPKDYHSPRDAYEVVAMADSRLVEIQPRTNERGTEYRMVFVVSCTFLYYYDLVTSLAPDIKAAFDNGQGGFNREVDISLKAGQAIGRIGGQTLDFAVWDTTKPLTGFVVPEHYKEEFWKLYTADPLDYYTDELKSFALSRYIRTVPPVSGKIDYDIDGKLVGNWFLEGTDGYRGLKSTALEGYSKTHLAFVPNHVDPSRFMISVGENFNGQFGQYLDTDNAPDPKDVGMESGLVKYDLIMGNLVRPDGTPWRNTLETGLVMRPVQSVAGCALVQMLESRKIKFESFGERCDVVSGFTGVAKIYTR